MAILRTLVFTNLVRFRLLDNLNGSCPYSKSRFFPGTPVFPSPQKLTFQNSSLIWNPRETGFASRTTILKVYSEAVHPTERAFA